MTFTSSTQGRSVCGFLELSLWVPGESVAGGGVGGECIRWRSGWGVYQVGEWVGSVAGGGVGGEYSRWRSGWGSVKGGGEVEEWGLNWVLLCVNFLTVFL